MDILVQLRVEIIASYLDHNEQYERWIDEFLGVYWLMLMCFPLADETRPVASQ
jgi:hypothetical protein